MDDDDTAQQGQRACGAVAVSSSRTVSCSTVTLSRRTSGVDASSVVTNVCRPWVISLQDTARLQVPPALTKTDDDPGNYGELCRGRVRARRGHGHPPAIAGGCGARAELVCRTRP